MKKKFRSDESGVGCGLTRDGRRKAQRAIGRCRFARRGSVWALQADCAISEMLALPRGVSLDGAGRTISLAGDAEAFASAGVRVSDATVRDLTIDGQALGQTCPAYLAALVIDGPATAENVTVTNVRFGNDRDHAAGIEVAAFDGARVELRDIRVTNIGGTALFFSGDGSVVVAGSVVRDATREIQATPGVRVAVAAPRPVALAQEPAATILFHPCHEMHRGIDLASPVLAAQWRGSST